MGQGNMGLTGPAKWLVFRFSLEAPKGKLLLQNISTNGTQDKHAEPRLDQGNSEYCMSVREGKHQAPEISGSEPRFPFHISRSELLNQSPKAKREAPFWCLSY